MRIQALMVTIMLLHVASAFPPQGRLMPDGAPVPEDAVAGQDSLASASETDDDYEDADDSDMYMEPEDAEDVSQEAPIPLPESNSTRANATLPKNVPPSAASSSVDQEAENTKETPSGSLETESQNFFPSFAELFSSHRLPFAEQQRYRPNRFLGYFQRGFQPSPAAPKEPQHPLLGSGNFGVIRGGTYYPEDKETDEFPGDDAFYRGRSGYYRNPKPQPIRGGDFFANFRDFADITAPPKSSFSHLSVVYANKNESDARRVAAEPRNIFETLRMLEEEEPRKKMSKGKRKLTKMRQSDLDKARRSRLALEPLLALS